MIYVVTIQSDIGLLEDDREEAVLQAVAPSLLSNYFATPTSALKAAEAELLRQIQECWDGDNAPTVLPGRIHDEGMSNENRNVYNYENAMGALVATICIDCLTI